MMKQGTEDTLPRKKDKKIYKSRDTPLAIACVLLLYLLVFTTRFSTSRVRDFGIVNQYS